MGGLGPAGELICFRGEPILLDSAVLFKLGRPTFRSFEAGLGPLPLSPEDQFTYDSPNVFSLGDFRAFCALAIVSFLLGPGPPYVGRLAVAPPLLSFRLASPSPLAALSYRDRGLGFLVE